MNSESRLQALLDEFISLTQTLDKLLKDDLQCFNTHNITALEQNNTQKQNIQLRMDEMVQAFQNAPELATTQGTIYQKIQHHAAGLTKPAQSQLEGKLAIMAEVLTDYKQSMLINHLVVSANLGFLKEVMLAILHHNNKDKQQPVTYGSRGELDTVL